MRKFTCEGVFNPFEIWIWQRIEGLGQSVTILFYQPWGMGRPKLWDPMADGRAVLYSTEGNMARSQPSQPDAMGAPAGPSTAAATATRSCA